MHYPFFPSTDYRDQYEKKSRLLYILQLLGQTFFSWCNTSCYVDLPQLQGKFCSLTFLYNPERTKQMEQILNFQVPSRGLELVILLHKLKISVGMIRYDSRQYLGILIHIL